MHEMSIASSILDAVRAEAALRPGCRVAKVGVRVGELSGVEQDSLSFCFEALVNGSDLEPLALAVEYCPRRNRCPQCETGFPVTEYDFTCPSCGNTATLPDGGDELELAFLEIEEP